MENDSAAVECLILFYLNSKHVLKTRQLFEKVFMEELVKQYNTSSLNNYNSEQIKKTWKYLVSKYVDLKNNGSMEDKSKWEYFDILDSCYESTDFHNSLDPKFSEEMVWLLIECFLKRKALRKIEKHSSIVAAIQKEFLQNGYLYITKQDIENKWRHLQLKYEKLKGNPDNFKKFPYLWALKSIQETKSQCVTKMIFTTELTQILIERFTVKKIRCIVHGYDSDQVLSEIQMEFKELGFYFSKEEIKEKWKKLMTIFKFLVTTGHTDSTWVYFNDMRNHFKDDFLFPLGYAETSADTNKNSSRSRRLRGRSKSMGAETKKMNLNTSDPVTMLEKASSSSKIKLYNDETKNTSIKRSIELGNRSRFSKKLKTGSKIAIEKDVNPPAIHNRKSMETKLNKSVMQTRTSLFKKSSSTNVSIIDKCKEGDCGGSELESMSEPHVINNSDIEIKNENLAINLPSISNKHADNEFVPLKKRLRTDGANDSLSDTTNEIKTEIITDDPEDHKYINVSEHNNTYEYSTQQRLIVPKEEPHDSLPKHNYTNSIGQPPVFLLVIKVDSNSTSKDSTSADLTVQKNNKTFQNSISESNSDERKCDIFVKQEIEQNDIQSHGTSRSTDLNSSDKQACRSIKDLTTSLESNIKNGATIKRTEDNLTNWEQFTTGLNSDVKDYVGNEKMSDVCRVAKSVSVSSTEDIKDVEIKESKNEEIKTEKPRKVNFLEPLTVMERSDKEAKFKVNSDNNLSAQVSKQASSPDKIRLPVSGGGNLKEIFISPRELSKLKLLSSKTKNNSKKLNDTIISKNLGDESPKIFSDGNKIGSHHIVKSPSANLIAINQSIFPQNKIVKNDESESKSVLSEATGGNGDLKNNLLATVIDFQAQNNHEFIEIKNLMKQNNLLQRETNRLLRLIMDKK